MWSYAFLANVDNQLSLNTNNADIQNTIYDNSIKVNTNVQRGFSYEANLDYMFPIGALGVLDAGMEANFLNYKNTQNTTFFDARPQLSQVIGLKQTKNSYYLMHMGEIGGFEFNIGARMEQYVAEGRDKSDAKVFGQNYLKVFPNV